MPIDNAPQPTNAELDILRVLWDRGPCTVRAVHDALKPLGKGYTTVLKLMQIMTEKGLVTRDTSERSHVYKARHSKERTQRTLVGNLLDRAFSGAADQLVMQALASKKASPAELAAIRKLLDEVEGKRQ